MFQLIEPARPGFNRAQISDDGLTIEWDSSLSEPPWDDLYMERYHKEFMQALFDYRTAEVKFKKLEP